MRDKKRVGDENIASIDRDLPVFLFPVLIIRLHNEFCSCAKWPCV